MRVDDCFVLGKITKPHSFKGEVVLWFDVDEPAAYAGIDGFFVDTPTGLVPYFITEIRAHQDRFVARLEGVDDEASALAIAGSDMYLPLAALPELDDSTFYFHEVPGWEVVDAVSGEGAGQITRVLEHGPYPLLETTLEGKALLIPLPDHLDIHVDRTARTLTIALPEGLIDVFLGPDTNEDQDDGGDAD